MEKDEEISEQMEQRWEGREQDGTVYEKGGAREDSGIYGKDNRREEKKGKDNEEIDKSGKKKRDIIQRNNNGAKHVKEVYERGKGGACVEKVAKLDNRQGDSKDICGNKRKWSEGDI